MMKTRNLLPVTALLLCTTLLRPPTANAWAFYWSKVEVQSSSWQQCMNISYGVFQQQNLTGIKRDNLAVSGSRNGASATVTCVGTGGNSKAMAVVMVVGDLDGPVRQLRDTLANQINRMRILDNNP
jgi:hypothetical protein